jgi:predicted amidohydrolase
MRLLLAAMECAKGGVDANLRRHVDLLEEAAGAGCDLALFPEFSLTGSVDPRHRPERALPVDAGPVRELVAETRRTGVAAVFGIAERSTGGFHITQLYAHDGRLDGAYRKRHLGEGEEGFEVGVGPGVFRLGGARFGVTICAEGEVDFPWEDVALAGAPLVLFCSAPGLDGRRVDQAGWRAGHHWWCSAGLGDAVRHARQLGVWVAMATQAGSTEDEDFPGLAALVRPDGEVAARLPDWRPGRLVVDVPVPVTVEPAREAVRVLVVDELNRALLVRFADAASGPGWWAPPGGGLEPGEDHRDAANRELREELGRDDLAIGPWIGHRSHTFETTGRWMTQRERWTLCRTSRFEVDPERVATLRAEGIHDLRWWSADELRTAGALTTPRGLVRLLDALREGRVPDPDEDLRV